MYKTIIPVFLVAAMAIAAESCSGGSGSDTIEFETRTDSVGYLVPDYYGDSVYSAAKYSVVWPEKIGEQDFNALRDSLISLTFAAKTDDFHKAAEAFLKRGLGDLADSNDTTTTSMTKVDYETAFNAPRANIQLINSEVGLLTPDVLSIGVMTETYFYGAAHGMRTKRFLNYSIKNHELMTPANTFKAGSDKEILSLITESAKRKYPAEGTLFADPITFYNNFEIGEQEIIFVYQPYDIGPYSSGIIEVPVSTYDLYRFLTPEAISTLGL